MSYITWTVCEPGDVPLAGTPGQAYVERRGVPGHVVEPDGRILLEGASEAQDVVLGYIPAGVLA